MNQKKSKVMLTMLLCLSFCVGGCYTQFASSSSVARIQEPTTINSEEFSEEYVDDNGTVIINNYYDSYYSRFMRPTIYGYGSAWAWGNPIWDYPLWYSPMYSNYAFWGGVPVFGVWGWNHWRNPYYGYPYYGHHGNGGLASTAPLGTRRRTMGRIRPTEWETNAASTDLNRLTTPSNRTSTGTITSPDNSSRRRGTTTIKEQSSRSRTREKTVNRRSQSSNTGQRSTERETKVSPSSPQRQQPVERVSPQPQRGTSSSQPSGSGGNSGSSGRRTR